MSETDSLPVTIVRNDEDEVTAVLAELEFVQQNYDQALRIARDQLEPGDDTLNIQSNEQERKVIFCDPAHSINIEASDASTKRISAPDETQE